MFELAPAVGMSGNYQIKNSLRFNSADSASMTRAFAASGTTATFSFWLKRTSLSTVQRLFGWTNGVNASFGIQITAADQIDFWNYASGFNARKTTSAVLRDVSAWYHVVCVQDTTNATGEDRLRIYINGVRQTSFSASTIPTQNLATYLGTSATWAVDGTNGYVAEYNFIDGQALDATYFGKTDSVTGQWIPKKYVGTYGTSGFYLPFDDGTSTTTLGYDRSGNANNWTLTNFSVAAGVNNDWMQDTPTNNFCTLNPLQNAIAPTNGAVALTSSTTNYSGISTFTMTSGKWYWECTLIGGSVFPMFGIVRNSIASNSSFWATTLGYAYYYDGTKYNNSVSTAYGAAYTTNDIIGVAFDADAGSLTFYKNGVSQGVAFTGLTSGDFAPAIGQGSNVSVSMAVNFGQRAFAYTPPTGFKALCTKNLPTPTVKKGSKHFNTVTWIGDGTGTTKSITGVGFAPDFVWVKNRSAATANLLYDAVRGAGNNKELVSNSTVAEGGENPDVYDYLSSFDSDGFTSTWSGSNTRAYFNNSGNSYVAWNWKANVPAVSNTDGTITAQVSANPTAGFSIVTYTANGIAGATVGHGLGVAPSMIIIKQRGGAGTGWHVYHASANASPATGRCLLNTTDAWATDSTAWNNTNPSTSVFTLGTSAAANYAPSYTYVAYCFAEVPGYSKIGKYTGNGSTDGPFVYCGFKPRYVMIKRTDVANNWHVYDTARDTYNAGQALLYQNAPVAEAAFVALDFLSNGFKVRTTDVGFNASGGTYIFMAIADVPFKYSTAR